MSYPTAAETDLMLGVMAPNPQIWTVNAILKHGYGHVLAYDETRRAIALRLGHMFFAEGPLVKDMADTMIAAMPDEALFFSAADAWNDYMESNGSLSAARHKRALMRFDDKNMGRIAPYLEPPPPGFAVSPIGAAEYARIIVCEWADTVFDSFDGFDDFARRGFGFCALDQNENNKIVSVCLSFAGSDYGYESEVDTDPAYQGRGFGKRTGAHFIAECHKRGATALWDSSNETSRRLALSLGFTVLKEFTALSVRKGEGFKKP